jgi:hypothetical protein
LHLDHPISLKSGHPITERTMRMPHSSIAD